MVIQGHEDDQLRLCDIARVEHGYAEPVRNEMSYEGQRALGIAVAAASGSDIVKVGAEVERCLAELPGRALPCGSRLPQDFLPARAGQGCAGDVSDKPDRVGGDRRGHSDAYDGFPQRNDHRHQSGGDRRGIVPDSGDGRRNDAARVAGGVHPGHGNAGRQCHRDRGRHPDRPETRETAPRGDDGHRPEDGDAAAGCDADRHPFVPADLPLARYGGCLRARSVHRAGRVAAAELGAGAGACAAHGRRMARSVCCSGRRRDALRQCCLPLVACGARLRPAASLVVDRRGARAGGAERLGLRLHASGLLPRYGLRPALYGVQTARGDEFDPREGRFGGDPPLFEEPSGDPLGGRFDRRNAGALQSGAQHRHAVAFVRRADYRFRVSGGAGTQYRRHPADAFGSLS